jgi:hypothetical protein
MEKPKFLRTLLIYSSGFATGVLAIILFLFIVTLLIEDVSRKIANNRVYTFGDIKLVKTNLSVSEGTVVPQDFYENADKILTIAKQDIPFIQITKGKSGEITGCYLLKGKERSILSLKPVPNTGE